MAAVETRDAGTIRTRKPIYRHLYFWVLVGIVAGIVLGIVAPDTAEKMKPLADGFVKLIKMVVAPVIFCTVVVGIAGLGNLSKAGRVGLKALGYFLALTLVALVIGLVVVNVVRPGAGLDITPDKALAKDTLGAADQVSGPVDFLLHIIPDSFVGAFADGEVIQVLFLAILTAVAITFMGARGAAAVRAIDTMGKVIFGIIRIVMYAAPIGAFGGMAFTVGAFGAGTLKNLGLLMISFYATCLVFIFVVLGVIARLHGFSIFKFVRLIKDELLIVLGTSSSETVLPRMLAKMEASGASKSVVGLTIPTGYSFNLDGTCIYLTMGALFIAQATGQDLSIGQQVGLLLFMLLASKGAAGVTGAGLVTLAASLSAFGTIDPVGIALIVGIDRFMSEARALTNLIGNGVAAMVVAKWEGERDDARFQQVLDDPSLVEDADLEAIMHDDLLVPADGPDTPAATREIDLARDRDAEPVTTGPAPR
jgi:aerobic C4-dicarboxylate transport protein